MLQIRQTLCRRVLRPLANYTTTMQRNTHTEQKVEVSDGIALNYVQSGSGDKSVLLMPGALGSAWTDFKPQILPNHTIIAWDPPGYGKSKPPSRQFGLDFYQRDAKHAVELMRALGRTKFSILGWSDGGITGLIVAGQFAECVEKLVIWGAGAYLNAEEVKALQTFHIAYGNVSKSNYFTAIRDVQKWSPRMREPMEKIYGVDGFAKLWADWVDAAVAIFNEAKGDFCCTEVNQVKAPTFILHGKKDPMIAAEHIPYLRERLQGCKYHEFPEGKHNIHLRYADEFNKLVAEFLLEKP